MSNGNHKKDWSKGYKTKKEAKYASVEKQHEIHQNGFIPSNLAKLTTAQYLLEWLGTAKNQLESTTAYGYENNITRHTIPNIGEIPIAKLNVLQIDRLYRQLLAGVNGNQPLSPTSVRYVHRTLHKALEDGVRKRILARNESEYATLPKKVKYKAKVLQEHEFKLFLDSIKGTWLYLPVLLGLNLGLRRSEILGLSWSDVDFKNNQITVNHALIHAKKGYELKEPKSETSNRPIRIAPELKALLEIARKAQNVNRLQYPQNYRAYNLVICRENGLPVYPTHLSEAFTKFLIKNNLPNVRLHDLRHSYATLLSSKRVPLKLISAILGHSSIATTMDLYAHVGVDMQEEYLCELDHIFFS
jgi:integrase